jgi:hypothetical protein
MNLHALYLAFSSTILLIALATSFIVWLHWYILVQSRSWKTDLRHATLSAASIRCSISLLPSDGDLRKPKGVLVVCVGEAGGCDPRSVIFSGTKRPGTVGRLLGSDGNIRVVIGLRLLNLRDMH